MEYSLSVITPVFNGDYMVEDFLKQISDLGQEKNVLEVVVVNDGSRHWDVNENGLKVLFADRFVVRFFHHKKNRGKGAAVRSGIEVSKGTHFLMLDVDRSTSTDSVGSLVHTSQEHPEDFVCGSRYMKGGVVKKAQKKWRQKAGFLGSQLVRVLFKISFHDTQCGAKIFPAELGVIIVNQGVSDRWIADVEWILLAKRSGITLNSVPIVWSDSSVSQVRPWHFLVTAWDVLMVRLRF